MSCFLLSTYARTDHGIYAVMLLLLSCKRDRDRDIMPEIMTMIWQRCMHGVRDRPHKVILGTYNATFNIYFILVGLVHK